MYYYSGFPQSMTTVPTAVSKKRKSLILLGLLGLFYFLSKK